MSDAHPPIHPGLLAGKPLNPILAFVFGLLFGPFGLIYVSRRLPRATTGIILAVGLAILVAGVFVLLSLLTVWVWVLYPVLFGFVALTAAKTYNHYLRTTGVLMNWSLKDVPDLDRSVRHYFKDAQVDRIFDKTALPAERRKEVLDTMVDGVLKRYLARLSLTLKPADLEAFTALLERPPEAMTFLKARIPNWKDLLIGEAHNFLRSFAETLLKDNADAV